MNMPAKRMSWFLRPLALLAAAGSAAVATAEPPGLDAARGKSQLDRALESRSAIATRAADRAAAAGELRAGAAVHGSMGLGTAGSAASPHAAGSVATGAAASAAGVSHAAATAGASGRAAAGTESTSAGNGVGLGLGLATGGQSAEFSGLGGPDLRSGARLGLEGRTPGTLEAGVAPVGRTDRPRFGFGWRLGRDEHGTAGNVRLDETSDVSHGARLGLGRARAATWSGGEGPAHVGVVGETEHATFVGRGRADARGPSLTQAERHLAIRLAQIDKMRDRAVETGDEQLLLQADRLEALARAQYSQRVDGETTVGATMRAFNEDVRTGRREAGQPDSPGTNATNGSETTGDTTSNVTPPASSVTTEAAASANASANVATVPN
jgi:hypothetical protein